MCRQRFRAYEGQVLVLMAIAMVVMLGFTALAVDVGHLLGERRMTQNAADAAALAGARLLMLGRSDSEIIEAARDYALRNGYTGPFDVDNVQIDRGARTVRVSLTEEVEPFFIGVVYTGDWQANARAVAQVGTEPGDYALLALDENNPNAINLIGNVEVHVVGGGAMSNGGMRCVGNGSLYADTTVDAHMVPGFSETGNCEFEGAQGRNGGMPVVEDPLRDVPPPPAPTVPAQVNPAEVPQPYPCTVLPPGRYTRNLSCSGNGHMTFQSGTYRFDRNVTYSGNGSVTLNPGFYEFNGGFRITGNSTVTLHPGTYVFRGGDFEITGNATLRLLNGEYRFYFIDGSFTNTGNIQLDGTSASQITVYMKDSDFATTGNSDTRLLPGLYYFDGGTFRLIGNQTIVGEDVLFYLANGATMDVVGNTSYRLSGSTTPLYPGMQLGLTIFQQRGNSSTFRMVGNSETFIRGIVYLPDATLELSGNVSGTWAEGQLIVDQLKNNGNTDARVVYRNYVDIELPAVWLIQ